jgi:hypothetical protein
LTTEGDIPVNATSRETSVASTILEQLGGSRFVAMTGARNIMSDGDALCFKLPQGFARNGINYVRIQLDPSDTYTVRFTKIGRAPSYRIEEVGSFSHIYTENLCELFREQTGLETRMPELRRAQ